MRPFFLLTLFLLTGCTSSLASLHERAESGDSVAQERLGKRYINAIGVPQDCAQGMKWLRKASDQENPDAELLLSQLHDIAVRSGHKDSLTKAGSETLRAKAFQGFLLRAKSNDAHAQAMLGNFYLRGFVVKKNYKEALKWYRKAADQGDPDGEFGIGALYQSGWGVKKDDVEAVNWFRKAAINGHPAAKVRLAGYLDVGRGAAQNQAEALSWRRNAVESDDGLAAALALFSLSFPYGKAESYSEISFWRAVQDDALYRDHPEKRSDHISHLTMTPEQSSEFRQRVHKWEQTHPQIFLSQHWCIP